MAKIFLTISRSSLIGSRERIAQVLPRQHRDLVKTILDESAPEFRKTTICSAEDAPTEARPVAIRKGRRRTAPYFY